LNNALPYIIVDQLICLIKYNPPVFGGLQPGDESQMSNVEDRVRKIVAEQLGVKLDEITNDSSFVEDLGADSLDTVELVMALEEEFETEIPDEDAEKITKVQEAIDYVNSNQ